MVERVRNFILVCICVGCSFLIFSKVALIRMGGYMMFPIILSSLFAFGVIFAKMRQFLKTQFNLEAFLKNIFECIERQRIKEAIDLCDSAPSPIAHIFKAGIMKYDCPKEEIKAVMERSFLEVVSIFEEGIAVLFSIVQIVPLLGFIGVLIGMIHIFQAMQANGMSFSNCLANGYAFGVWEALICSAISLLLSIVLLIAYHYLAARADFFIEEAQKGSMKLFNFFLERRESFNV
ncbi:MAG: MotA/TolQ/ExbB proton channel family protein [Candidatus Omnitrophota bacterium]